MYIKEDENGIVTTSEKGWRLFYNGDTVIDYAEQDFTISTGGGTKVFIAATKAEVEKEIKKLKLIVPQHVTDKHEK